MARTYHLPQFNLEVLVWYGLFGHDYSTWSDAVPAHGDAVTITGQLYSDAYDQVQFGVWNTSQFGTPTVLFPGAELRVPKETQAPIPLPHIITSRTFSVIYPGPDADGKFRFYVVQGEVIRHKGFPNEHKAWVLDLLMQLDTNPYP